MVRASYSGGAHFSFLTNENSLKVNDFRKIGDKYGIIALWLNHCTRLCRLNIVR